MWGNPKLPRNTFSFFIWHISQFQTNFLSFAIYISALQAKGLYYANVYGIKTHKIISYAHLMTIIILKQFVFIILSD